MGEAVFHPDRLRDQRIHPVKRFRANDPLWRAFHHKCIPDGSSSLLYESRHPRFFIPNRSVAKGAGGVRLTLDMVVLWLRHELPNPGERRDGCA